MSFRSFFLYKALFAVTLTYMSCSAPVSCVGDAGGITVMTYNAQTFFDAVEDGTEFSEFRGVKTKWSASRYSDRLDRLREAILLCGSRVGEASDCGPDVVVLQEIENASVLRDLCNRLPQRGRYPYAAFVQPSRGSAFASAILSRYPVTSLTAHDVGDMGAALRPLLEVELTIGGDRLVIFAAHWKSKSGDGDGESGTAAIRLAQERLLVDRVAELRTRDPSAMVLACGDFNQTREDFLARAGEDSVRDLCVDCWDDWLSRPDSGIGPIGSYYYDARWETIDHIFAGKSLFDNAGWELDAFAVVASEPLVNEDETPARYELYSGRGYSDHLPLVACLRKVD